MSKASNFAPFGSADNMSERLGQSYIVMKGLYDEIEHIIWIGEHKQALLQAANNIRYTTTVIPGLTEEAGDTVFIELPDGISEDQVSDYGVIIVGSDDSLYSATSGYFTARIEDSHLEVALSESAPAELEAAVIRWTLSFRNVA